MTCCFLPQEKNIILGSLKQRADMVYKRFNKIPGVFCNPVEGAMYAFPRIDIPEKAWGAVKVQLGSLIYQASQD